VVDAARPRRSVLPAAAGTYGANMVGAMLSLASVLLTARMLGPSGRGELALLTTIVLLTAVLSTLGVEEAAANAVAQDPDRKSTVAGSVVLLALVSGTLAAGIVGTLAVAVPSMTGHLDHSVLALALAAVPLLVLQIYLQFLVRADYGFRPVNATVVIGPLVNVAVNGALAALGILTVTSALTTWVAGQALATGILARWVSKRLDGFGRPDLAVARGLLGFGLKAYLGRVMKTGNYRLDQWILGALAGPSELGLYSIAVAWSEALFYLPEAVGAVLRPDVARAMPEAAGRRTARLFRLTILVSAPVALLLIVAAPLLCVGVFGSRFSGSVVDLRVLAPGVIGIVAIKLLSSTLTAQRRPMLGNLALAVALGATIVLDLILIPAHGALGAAIASTSAYSLGGVAIAVVFARSLGVRFRELVPSVRDILDARRRLPAQA